MDNAIEIKNLSKKYLRGSSASYYTLRETLAALTSSTVKRKAKSTTAKKSGFWALDNISLSVKRGEVLGIVGPNGAGKSTLLKILSKITYPTKGEAVLAGRVGSLLEVGTGFHQELTGRENIFLNGAVLGMTRDEVKRKFNQIVEFSGVEGFLDTPVKRYSSGMQIRLAFAVAAHLDPEILLVDEVLSVGDAEFQKRSLGKMEEISQENKRTILFVSHNLSAVRRLCTRVIFLRNGKIVADGEPQMVIDEYLDLVSKSSEDLEKRKDRKGTGIVKLVGYEFHNQNKKRVNGFVAGEDCYIRLRLKKTKRIKSVDILLQIVDGEGTKVCVLGNKLAGDTLDIKSETFECKIPKLPLTRGDYYVNASINADKEISDSLMNAFNIKVVSENYFESSLLYMDYGKTFVNHSWD
jgi:lipopolysaccharide transport system ATP-binding protein